MNGAAMDCWPDQALHTQHKDSGGHQSPGYHLQMNHPCEQYSHPQHSKAKPYQSLPDYFSVNSSSADLQHNDKYSTNSDCSVISGNVWKQRFQASQSCTRQPLELPVPRFEIDENYVGDPALAQEKRHTSVECSKSLDLDTRINLLIRSKALAGMHPIFTELVESEQSIYDSDKHLKSKSKSKNRVRKRSRSSPPRNKHFDDPEKPLSRPPSPFLSRASYLFWFNKGIELKQQAKAQEQALLEQAARKHIQEGLISPKANQYNQIENSNQNDKSIPKDVLNKISREVKEVLKQEFIREILENTAYNSLENWWEEQKQIERDEKKLLEKNSVVNSTTFIEHDHSSNALSDEPFKSDPQISTSPKAPFPWVNVDPESKKEFYNKESQNHSKKHILANVLHIKKSDIFKISKKSNITDICKKSLKDGGVPLVPKCVSGENMLGNGLCQESSNIKYIPEQSTVTKLAPDIDNTSGHMNVHTIDMIEENGDVFNKTENTVLSVEEKQIINENECNRPKCLELPGNILSSSGKNCENVVLLEQDSTVTSTEFVLNHKPESIDNDCMQGKENIPTKTSKSDLSEKNHISAEIMNAEDNLKSTLCSNSTALQSQVARNN